MSESLPLEALARLPEFYHPVASPGGDRIAVYYDGSGRNELYVVDAGTGERTRVSDGEVPRNARWPIRWGADGRVYFHRDEAGDEQNDLHAIDPDGGTAVVAEVDGQAILQDAASDGRFLLYTSDEREQMNVYRLDLETGERERLTAYDQPVFAAMFDPDGGRIAYVANESDDLENRDAYVMNADGSGKRALDVGDEGAEVGPADWHPDGDRLLLSDNSEDLGRVGVYRLDEDAVEWLGDGGHEERAVAFTPDGDRAVAVRSREAARLPVVYDLGTGEGRELDLPEGVAGFGGPGAPQCFFDDGSLLLPYTTPTRRKTLYRYDLDADEATAVVRPEYGDIDPGDFAGAEYVTYESGPYDIGALLYDSGERPSPGIVMVHGGPHAQATKSFDRYAQFLASKGYTVLQPNYRGSVGRGRDFKNAVHGDWGGGEQADIAAGGRWLCERDWVDEDRVGVFGGSYGGYSAYMQLVTYPDRWATGVAWIGITDLHALYEESMAHFRAILEEQMGDPEEHAERWRERSPITHVDAMERPVLMVHGVNDPRCPVSQARAFRDALESRGLVEGEDGDFEYVELGEEGHGSTDADQKVRAFRIVGDYLDRRL